MSKNKDKIPYVPRVVYEEYEKVYPDGRKVKKLKKINNFPKQLPQFAATAMSQNKLPRIGINNLGPLTYTGSMSNRKNKRFCSNKPKFHKNKLIRPLPYRVISQSARQMIRDGYKDIVLNPRTGRILSGFLTTRLKYPPEPKSSFHPKKDRPKE